MSALYDTFKAMPLDKELFCCYLDICPNANNKDEEKIKNERNEKEMRR